MPAYEVYFSQVKFILPITMTDKWSPCLYLIPWSLLFLGFCFCFSLLMFSLFLLGDEERVEWAAGWEFDCWPRLTHQRQHPWSTSKIQLQNSFLPEFLLLWLECSPVAYTQCPSLLKQSQILTSLYWLSAALTFCLALEQGSGCGTSPQPPVQWVCSASQRVVFPFSLTDCSSESLVQGLIRQGNYLAKKVFCFLGTRIS